MNFNSILQLLDNGLEPDQIVSYLRQASPQIAKKITKMLLGGYGTGEILKFLASDKETQNLKLPKDKSYNPADIARLADIQNRMNVPKDRDKQSLDELKKFTSYGLTAAATIAPFAMQTKMGQQALGALTGMMPGQPQQPQLPVPGAAPTGPQPTPPQPMPSPSPMQATPGQQMQQNIQTPAPAQQVAQAAQAVPQPQPQQPPEITQEQVDATPELSPEIDYLKKKNLLPKVQTMAKAGKSKEQIVAYLKKNMPMMEQEYFRSFGQPKSIDEKLGDVVDRFVTPQQATPIAKEEVAQEPITSIVEPNHIQKPEAVKKGDTVVTPTGMGEVKGEDSKGFLVESEGKTTRIPKEEAITSPLPKKELAQLFNDLVDGIETETGQEISRMVNIAGYNEEHNELFFKPWDGGLYIYDNIPKEDAAKLVNYMKRKTSGGNYIGPWVEGTDSPIGAAMSDLIKKLQGERGGKGKEYKRKYDILYEALAPGKEASKQAKKEADKAAKPKKEPKKKKK